MIVIISQDGTRMYSTSNINLNISEDGENSYSIYIYEKIDGMNFEWIGNYNTLDIAKKVLNDIAQAVVTGGVVFKMPDEGIKYISEGCNRK